MKKRLNAEMRKPDILKHFFDLILEEGIEGASIGKVAKKMKIHPSLIIHYFENKDNMIVALVDYVMKEYGKLLLRLKIETNDLEKRLERLVEIFFSDEWYRMTDISGDYSVISMSFRSAKIHARVRELYTQFIKIIVNEFTPMIEAGVISLKDPRRGAEMVISIVEGYRHFKHFYVDEAEAEGYRQDMMRSVLAMLRKS